MGKNIISSLNFERGVAYLYAQNSCVILHESNYSDDKHFKAYQCPWKYIGELPRADVYKRCKDNWICVNRGIFTSGEDCFRITNATTEESQVYIVTCQVKKLQLELNGTY